MLSPIEEIIAEIAAGKMIILVDDAKRENEGDLVVATEKLTPEHLAFMMHEARGLICVSIDQLTAERLNLPLQALDNSSPFQTPFTVSIDHRSVTEMGDSAAGRVATMSALLDERAQPEDFTIPGHVFPLIANPEGVIARQGQTEGSYDLAKLAGLRPSGVLCEILNPDGSMARAGQLNDFAQKHGIKIGTIDQIIRHRITTEILVRDVAHSTLQTDAGEFETYVFEDALDGKEHLALAYGDFLSESQSKGVMVRIHSECLTGDVFGSRRCDCGSQLDTAMKHIVDNGSGLLLYLRQEGRGIGLGNKLRAYALQDQGHDTVEANIQLGFAADSREYAVAAHILNMLKVHRVRLMTNNPDKLKRLEQLGVTVTERIPLLVEPDAYSRSYLETKRNKLGHIL
ncbi:MAG: GTP cyclohydrolase II [Deltaproteobacteria bacterium]|nr:GTP cyclohydrolase II [Deltaproteobacteria bacterium]